MEVVEQNRICEWSYTSRKVYRDPFNDIEVDVVFTAPDGEEKRVPAFWAGGKTWRVRYSSFKTGRHRYRTMCSDTSNSDLHGREGILEVVPYEGDNPLYKHGPIQLSQNRRYFEHVDGTPFFWLGDTWWMGLCKRLSWPDDFKILTADRVAKGFTVIQIVAGLYPDMPAFDPRGCNEAGFPWEEGYTRINPAYFDYADLRIDWLVQAGLVPCVVGCWGYYLPWMGLQKMKQHWRNLVARYGAYPVVWCLAGEGTMPYYLSREKEKERRFQKSGWTEVGIYLRQVDPYHRLVTIHPGNSARDTVDDPGVLDFDMLQTGHDDRESLPNTVRLVTESYHREPIMPVVDGEVCYEGIGESCRQEVQRLMFWACILNGAAGHTYGANGIWQVNTREEPFGPSPHGMAWGNTPWEDAMHLPGSRQIGLAKKLLERYAWWRFEPHPEWVEPHWTDENYLQPYAAGIPGEIEIVYLPKFPWGKVIIKGLEPGRSYHVIFFNPVEGSELEIGIAAAGLDGELSLQDAAARPFTFPLYQDWVVVLEKAGM